MFWTDSGCFMASELEQKNVLFICHSAILQCRQIFIKCQAIKMHH